MLKPLCLMLALATPAAAQQDHAAMHGGPPERPAVLTEPGQGAFAALAEVVSVLEADPATDWSRVDLDGLRAHLVDMDLLATRAEVRTERMPDGLRATATGGAKTAAALGRMVPAHAGQLAIAGLWSARGEATAGGAVLTVTSDDPATVARIHGLGFFGLMASRDHHREHHLAIARGGSPHGH